MNGPAVAPPSAGPARRIASAGPLADLVARLGEAPRVALDTEADSLYHYREKLCVFQLSFSGLDYIVDPLAARPLGVARVLATKPLVIHGADYDLRLMRACSASGRPLGSSTRCSPPSSSATGSSVLPRSSSAFRRRPLQARPEV